MVASIKRPINVPLRKGALEGYHVRDSSRVRRTILLSIIKKGHSTYAEVIKRLNVLAIYNKNRTPEVTEILRKDIAFLQRQLSPPSLKIKSQKKPKSPSKSQKKLKMYKSPSPKRGRSITRTPRSQKKRSPKKSKTPVRRQRKTSPGIKKTSVISQNGGAKKKSSLSCKQKKIAQVMGEFKRKKLRSPYKKLITNPKQAIAIALNVADRACPIKIEKKKKK